MYFPTAAARHLSGAIGSVSTPIVHLSANSRKSLFCTLSKDAIAVWRARPTVILATLVRTSTSVLQHGDNAWANWSPDGNRIVIQTALSYLILVTVIHSTSYTPYHSPPLTSSSQRHFLPGPGEGHALPGISLRLEGVIRIQGQLLTISPRHSHILFTTQTPFAVQRIPWPTRANPTNEEPTERHDTWLLNHQDMPWLLQPNVAVRRIIHARSIGVEVWLTSDGRAYFVQPYEVEEKFANMGPTDDGVATPTIASTSEHASVASSSSVPPQGFDTPQMGTRSLESHRPDIMWDGTCIHGTTNSEVARQQPPDPDATVTVDDPDAYEDPSPSIVNLPDADHVTAAAINVKFSLVALGNASGTVTIVNFPLSGMPPLPSQIETLRTPTHWAKPGLVRSMEWTSDGYALAVGWEKGWAVWSVGGRCLVWASAADQDVGFEPFHNKLEDSFMKGVASMVWMPGNLELVALADTSTGSPDEQLFVIPFAKSAVTTQHSPDNTRYAFLQMDDRVLVYRGADQPDMSVINPESDVWQHIKIPTSYISTNWPLRYASISNDGRLIAVAGRRGLVHYSTASGRWKIFADEGQEQAFTIKGGLLWFHHVLIAGVEVGRSHQVRLYSRDLELSNVNVLHREFFPAPILLLSLVDNSLLVYTADNTLYHYLIIPTQETIKLHLCGSISFDGVVMVPNAVRGMSWMIPPAQKHLGDPTDDLVVATILLLVGGRLVLLRPKKSGAHEVKYDMHILADRIEFCWIHLRGIGTLENSLWGYDGKSIRVWLDALTMESAAIDRQRDAYESVAESVNIPLDFYPLSVLMDKGIIIGVEEEVVTRSSLPFVMFKILTTTHLFLHHVLRYHLGRSQVGEAVAFAGHYQQLVYFAHALEILLHTVVEAEAEVGFSHGRLTEAPDEEAGSLPAVIEFLDHFDVAMDVVVGCARKTEMARWGKLFSVVGDPQHLFDNCVATNQLKTAASYLLVLHNIEDPDGSRPILGLDGSGDESRTMDNAVRLLVKASSLDDWSLCQEILRFLRSIDETGLVVKDALAKSNLVPDDLTARSHE